MPLAQVVLIGCRGLHVAMLLSLFGALVFRVAVAQAVLTAAPGETPRLVQYIQRLARVSLVLALAFGTAWFVAEAAAIGGTQGVRDTLGVLPIVAWHTRFGETILIRAVLLLLTAVFIGRAERLAALVAGLALVLQGEFGHAGAAGGAEGTDLLFSEGLHLLAAGAWLGSLLPLWRGLAILPPGAAALACKRFSPIGMVAVLVLAGTGLFQGIDLIGSFPALVGTGYGQAALVKMVLFALMLALALRNRITLTDRLAGEHADSARRRLRRSVLLETLLGALVVAAAATLASLVPALHEQPTWPFPWRPSLAVLAEPELRQEVSRALLMTGIGVAAVAASLILRRARLVALIFLIVVVIEYLPSFELLLVEAYPTSFYTSPTGFAAAAIVQGQALFASHCTGCHGESGRGDGPAAAGLHVHPTDLTASHVLEHADGELFWWLTHGIEDPDGGLAMPGFATQLTEAQRWSLIDFVRARNAGAALQEDGHWPAPAAAPSVPLTCGNASVSDMQGLRGRVVEVIADAPGLPEPPEVPPQEGIPIIRLHLAGAAGAADCAAATPDAWTAYAVLAGMRRDALAGSGFLVDPNGWLRAVHFPGDGPGWTDPARLIGEIRQICTHPISNPSGGGHEHHQP